MKIHPVDSTNRSYDSVPQSFQTLDAGYCPLQQLSVVQTAFEQLFEEAKSNSGDARAAGTDTDMRRGHQKTAALILSILVDAIRTAAMLADPSQDDPQELAERIEDPDEFDDVLNDVRERPTQPRGSFTDVGQHTGGHPRCTTWPLVHHTFLALLQEQPLEHDTETTPATPACSPCFTCGCWRVKSRPTAATRKGSLLQPPTHAKAKIPMIVLRPTQTP